MKTIQNNSQKGNKHKLNTTVKLNNYRKYGSGLSGHRASKLSYCNWIYSKIKSRTKVMLKLLKLHIWNLNKSKFDKIEN